MPEWPRPAVVFGMLHAGLALTRALGRRGVTVHGITLHRNEFGLRSRYLASRRCVDEADPAARDLAVLAALRALAAAAGQRLVLLLERDENVAFVLDNWQAVNEVADVPLPPDPEVTRSLRRKERLVQVAEEAGVPTPRTVLATDEAAIIGAGLRPPFLLKPVEGQDYALAFGHKALPLHSIDEALAAWRRAHEAGFEMLVQELIPDSTPARANRSAASSGARSARIHRDSAPAPTSPPSTISASSTWACGCSCMWTIAASLTWSSRTTPATMLTNWWRSIPGLRAGSA